MSSISVSPIGRVTEVYPRGDRAGMPLGLRVDRQVIALRMGAPEAGPDLEHQARGVFAAMRELVERAGGGLENIAKATAYVATVEEREPVNSRWWEEAFPDPGDKPAYKVLVAPLPAGRRVEASTCWPCSDTQGGGSTSQASPRATPPSRSAGWSSPPGCTARSRSPATRSPRAGYAGRRSKRSGTCSRW